LADGGRHRDLEPEPKGPVVNLLQLIFGQPYAGVVAHANGAAVGIALTDRAAVLRHRLRVVVDHVLEPLEVAVGFRDATPRRIEDRRVALAAADGRERE